MPLLAVVLALLSWSLTWKSDEALHSLKVLQAPVEQEVVILDDEDNSDDIALVVTLVPAPNFSAISLSDERKRAFVTWLLPMIAQENALIASQRKEAVALYALWQKHRLSLVQKEWLGSIATDYDVDFERKGFTLSFWQNLLHRLDVIPPSLVLTQAAIETGWGTSRLAKDANNFFGIMCFRKGCGIPLAGSVGEFRRFNDDQASVSEYMRIINTKGAYRSARMERMLSRLLGDTPSGMTLAKTLLNYSELGKRYVNFLIQIMTDNQLDDYDGADMRSMVEVIPADIHILPSSTDNSSKDSIKGD
jgi:Bax protein